MTDPVGILRELERDLPGTDMLDLDQLLLACHYECRWGDRTRVYYRADWPPPFTFRADAMALPMGTKEFVLGTVRSHLKREGFL